MSKELLSKRDVGGRGREIHTVTNSDFRHMKFCSHAFHQLDRACRPLCQIWDAHRKVCVKYENVCNCAFHILPCVIDKVYTVAIHTAIKPPRNDEISLFGKDGWFKHAIIIVGTPYNAVHFSFSIASNVAWWKDVFSLLLSEGNTLHTCAHIRGL